MTEYMNERVSDPERDQVMEIILSYPENNKCFDCGSKNPNWASTYLGIVICFECAGKHRGFGTHISFVRSVNLDKWNRKQLKSMELAGNQYARLRFNDQGVPKDNGVYDYFNDQVNKYKNDLAEKVASSLSGVGVVKVKVEQKIEQPKVEEVIEETKKEEYSEPTKVVLKKEQNNEIKLPKTNKIKKVDFDFDFDNFNDDISVPNEPEQPKVN
jgi:ADP-ribosylation factor GTPase-activating protein 1